MAKGEKLAALAATDGGVMGAEDDAEAEEEDEETKVGRKDGLGGAGG